MFHITNNYISVLFTLLCVVVVCVTLFTGQSALAQGGPEDDGFGVTAPDPVPNSPPHVEARALDVLTEALTETGDDCGLTTFLTPGCLLSVVAILFALFVTAMMYIFWIVGIFFNAVVMLTVVSMGALLKDPSGNLIAGITVSWSAIRDIANLVFMFGIIFIGINTILGIAKYGYKQLLVRLIIAALLINFSLTIATLIVDVSNLFATEVYTTLVANDQSCVNYIRGTPAGGLTTSPSYQECLWNGISTVLGNSAAISSIASAEGLQKISSMQKWEKGIVRIGMYILTMIVVGVFAFVLAVGAGMLLARFATLVILIIFSPIAFAGMVLPYTSSIASGWWEKLIKNALFAPVFFLLLLVSITVMNSLGLEMASTGSLAGLFAGDAAAISVLINYTVVIILLSASIIVASRFGIYGADASRAVGKRWARNLTSYAYTGAMNLPGIGPARLLARAGRTGQSVDASIDKMTGAKGSLARGARTALGAASLGILSRKSREAAYNAAQDTTLGGYQSARQSIKTDTEFARTQQRALTQAEAFKRVSNANKYYSESSTEGKKLAGKYRQGTENNKQTLERLKKEDQERINRITLSEIKSNKGLQEQLSNPHVAAAMNDALHKRIRDDDSLEISDETKTKIGDARHKLFTTKVNANDGSLPAEIQSMPASKVVALPKSILINPNFARHLTWAQLSAMSKNNDITPQVRSAIRRVFENDEENMARLTPKEGLPFFKTIEGSTFLD